MTGQLLLSGMFSGKQVLLGMAESAAAGEYGQAHIKSIIAIKFAILRMDIHHLGKAELGLRNRHSARAPVGSGIQRQLFSSMVPVQCQPPGEFD